MEAEDGPKIDFPRHDRDVQMLFIFDAGWRGDANFVTRARARARVLLLLRSPGINALAM